MEMIKLQPTCKDYLWGGVRLKEEYNVKTPLDIVAEAWQLSAHKDGPALIANGKYQGKNFIEYLQIQGKECWGSKLQKYDNFPILIKFIDAKQALSIQVHPNDEYALKHEGEYGKNEMWYIVDCDEDSYIYFGVNKKITKTEYQQHLKAGTILEILNKVKVKKGDCFFIKAGTIHAIGEGCLICEIQQNSNSTYRIYDFDRVGVDGKKRELHIDKAIEVSILEPTASNSTIVNTITDSNYQERTLAAGEYFKAKEYQLQGELTIEVTKESFVSLIILEGSLVLKHKQQILKLKKGESVFLPADLGEIKIEGKAHFIKTNF
ncbi:MAG: type I phosphomannose isomerase catalytic subunit [Erysipelotrichaceae bacterium]